VLANLWKIEDDATRVLMGEFYRALWDAAGPVGKAEALRRAQRAMIRHYDPSRHALTRGVGGVVIAGGPRATGPLHPFFWAAFTLDGDWR
jgi:CHAT domain-containing protein